MRDELREIVEAVESVDAPHGEGLERELRSRLRGWLRKRGWNDERVRMGERFDVLLLDQLGLPAVYIETKDPNTGIRKSETAEALERSQELAGLRSVVMTDGRSYIEYSAGVLNPDRHQDSWSVDEGGADLTRLTALFDPDTYQLGDPAAPLLEIAEQADRQQLVSRLKQFVPSLGDVFLRLCRAGLTSRLDMPGMRELFDDWLLFGYEISFSELLDVMLGEDLDAAWGVDDPVSILADHFPDLTEEDAQAFLDRMAGVDDAKQKTRAREVGVALLDEVGALRLFADQTALVAVARQLFARIWEEGGSPAAIPAREAGMERVVADSQAGAVELYREIRRELRSLDENLFGLGLYDWWHVSETLYESWSSDDQSWFAAWQSDLNTSLGQVWMLVFRSTFKNATRDVWREVYETLLPPEERLRLGGFYTDEVLVDFLLDLAGYDGSGSLVDPACGSGTFLVEALGTYLSESDSPRSPKQAAEFLEQTGERIVGIDIHPFAAVLGQLNMMLNLADVVIKASGRTEMPRFVFNGDALEEDIDVRERHPELVRLEATNGRAKEVIQRREATQEVKKKTFDWVVGNPPWGGVLRAGRPLSRHEYSGYSAMTGKSDIYVLFMELAGKMLRGGGAMAFVTQNRYLSREYGKGVHHLLTGQIVKNFYVEYVIDLGELGGHLFFPEQTNYPCLTIARLYEDGESPPNPALVRVTPEGRKKSERPSKSEFLAGIKSALEELDSSSGSRCTVERPSFSVAGSATTHDRLKELSDKRERWPIPVPEKSVASVLGLTFSIDQLFEVRQGATPGGSGEFQAAHEVYLMEVDEAADAGIEDAVLVPVVGGTDIESKTLGEIKRRALYPYPTSGGIVDLGLGLEKATNAAASRELDRRIAAGKIKYPGAARYLIGYYRELYEREFEGKTVGVEDKAWYRWHRSRDPKTMLACPKLVVRRSIKDEVASVDTTGVLALDSCWVMRPKVDLQDWGQFEDAVVSAAGSDLSLAEILQLVRVRVEQELLQRLSASDTPLQGGFLSVRKKDITSIVLDPNDI